MKFFSRNDKSTKRNLNRSKLSKFLHSWKELAKHSKNGHIRWATKPIIFLGHRSIRDRRTRDYDDKFWNDNDKVWVNDYDFLLITATRRAAERKRHRKLCCMLARASRANYASQKLLIAERKNIFNQWEQRKLKEQIDHVNQNAEKGNMRGYKPAR